MAVELAPKGRLDLKRKIAELDRVRKQMKLDIVRMRRQPGLGTEEELADTVNSLVLLEDELRELTRRYEEGTSPLDSRD
jgi:tRNA uridine 5-carbamoylmethylation protein Kti12